MGATDNRVDTNEGGSVVQARHVEGSVVQLTANHLTVNVGGHATSPEARDAFPAPGATENATARLDESWSSELAEALCQAVHQVAAGLLLGRGSVQPGGTELDMWAHGFVVAWQEEGQLRTLLRWLHNREHGSERARDAIKAADSLMKAEELDVFDDAGEGDVVPSEQVRAALRAVPYEEFADTYRRIRRGRLDEYSRPLDAWDALLELYDLPPRPDGSHPVADFARWATGYLSGSSAVEELLDWPLVRASGPQSDTMPVGEGDRTPARLLVDIRPGTRGRLRVRHRAYLRRDPACPPEPTSGWAGDNVLPDQLAGFVVDLLTTLAGNPLRDHHEEVRLELIVPLDLLHRFPAARWTELVPLTGANGPAIRLGVKYQIIYRLREFFHCTDPRYRQSHSSCKRRRKHLHENGHGRLCSHDDLAPSAGRWIAEHLEDHEIVVYLAAPPDTEDWEAQIASAVYQGVPVIAWHAEQPGNHNTSQTDIRGRFRTLFAERDERIAAEHVTDLPRRLHELRRRRVPGTAEDPDNILAGPGKSTSDTDVLDFFVLYHADVDSVPASAAGTFRLFSRRAR